jgi:hypothetical protein
MKTEDADLDPIQERNYSLSTKYLSSFSQLLLNSLCTYLSHLVDCSNCSDVRVQEMGEQREPRVEPKNKQN